MFQEEKELSVTEPLTQPWRKRLDEALQRGRVLRLDMILGSDWTTCAVGEWWGPQAEDYADLDTALWSLGAAFSTDVDRGCVSRFAWRRRRNIRRAIRIHDQIKGITFASKEADDK